MHQTLKATYHKGTFVLDTNFDLPEGTQVELFIQSPQATSPSISDVDSKREFLKALVERMQQNPIPAEAPHFTRDMLHERR